MPEVVVVKTDQGKLEGLGEKNGRSWAKFITNVRALAVGDTMRFEYKLPRSPGNHRHFFKLLAVLFDSQEQFEDIDKMRMWLTVGAGYCTFAPGPDGALCALPESIAFHALDEAGFCELRGAVERFMWSKGAIQFLWPHLTHQQGYDAMEAVQRGFR